ncbi:hypothetical protein [Natrarchaeobaculum sulfurireducens]|uniref:HEAT repeats containing protein n=1 Tax=Natrarchaeobaculum sulfurireducens TaxID=2044521 RepID=A0A346PQ14_9EURY|nr:hypothetical protein [Natrarchaeobaculum sulfurireducens]AXR78362.1 hypothetical protein AArc1_2044 [Natrarchaeobaculum sulfurireducens]AXR81609.1 hypothetical protein AArcMg_1597 [Natrarchaeobaculum sulfurireducens]
MDGGHAVEEHDESVGFDLPSVLAQLDGRTPAECRDAVETVQTHVAENPDACLPTVPKLRTLLEQPDVDCQADAAYCLAELAEHSPVDVAPSADELATFVAERPAHDATPALIRSLAAISSDRPDALVDHVDALDIALENDAPEARAAGATAFGRLATETDATVDPVRDRLAELAADDPDSTVKERAAGALEQFP